MENNIDEDIKRCEDLIGFVGCELREIEANSIENVLSEFETLREISGGLVIDNANLKIETETWRKIAEKLASKLNEAYFEQNDFWLFFEKEILKGIEADYGYVGDVIIDWARKEVEKDG